jgi:signal transduction histidine kinase
MILFGGPAPPCREKMDINHLITEGMAFIGPRFDKSGIRFQCALDPALPMIIADPSQITQVIVNLVINAIHAMPEGGDLTITTKMADGGIQMMVQDTGTGMPPHIIDQIFLPFFTTKDVNKGTGLGLSVVHGIVSSHGGVIEVSSKTGRGTLFTIFLPAKQPQGEAGI